MILPKKNDEFVKGLIKQGEGENLDFKLAVNNPEKFAKTLAAFANTSGGIILVGINDQRKIIGIDVEEEMHMVEQANANYLHPVLDLQYEVFEVGADYGAQEEDVNLLLIRVLKSEKPCLHILPDKAQVLYCRTGDRNSAIPMPLDPDSPPKGN